MSDAPRPRPAGTDTPPSRDDDDRGAAGGAEITAALERAIVRQLANEWRRLNDCYFKGALRPPAFELSTSRAHLGRFSLESRTIEIARGVVLAQPWGVVIEVLKHEMAHQFVFEVRHIQEETAHGPAFREVCARLGIDPAAAGLPTDPGTEQGDPAETRAVERIARLLALAGSPNVHEAEAAMAAAQRLMLKHNLDSSHAHAAAGRGFSFRHLGAPSGRVTEAERTLASILGSYFFVEVIWVPSFRAAEGKRGSVLEITGTTSNLEIASYVHGYLTLTAARLWEEHKREAGLRSNRDRRTFLSGVMAGFAAKLSRETKKQASEGLVWVGDPALHQYFRRRHPYVRNVRFGTSRSGERQRTWERGRTAGGAIVLHRAVASEATSAGRLLPRGSR